jgi:hypothetical protein
MNVCSRDVTIPQSAERSGCLGDEDRESQASVAKPCDVGGSWACAFKQSAVSLIEGMIVSTLKNGCVEKYCHFQNELPDDSYSVGASTFQTMKFIPLLIIDRR